MKKIIIAIVLMAGTSTVKAQTSSAPDNDNYRAPKGIQQDNEFANTEIDNENGKIIFSDLPNLDRQIWAVVTNPMGEIITQKKVSPEQNRMDLRGLQKSEMYFLTLVYKKKSKKAFVLHL